MEHDLGIILFNEVGTPRTQGFRKYLTNNMLDKATAVLKAVRVEVPAVSEADRKRYGQVAKDYKKAFKLLPKWCVCAEPQFHSYPEDGQCTCGIAKHHVHCTCGRVSQVG